MTMRPVSVLLRTLTIAMGLVVLAGVSDVAAQPLPETATTESAVRLGPLALNPNLTIKNIGVEDNVFNDATNPKRDVAATISPDTEAILRIGVLRFRAYSVSDTVFYKRYRDIRGGNRAFDGRLDLLFERFRPFLITNVQRTQDRPNNEVDLRPRRGLRTVGGGFGVQLASRLGLVVTAQRGFTSYQRGLEFRDADVKRFLDRTSESVSTDLRFAATPLTTVVLTDIIENVRFPFESIRNNHSHTVGLRFEFSPDAVINGRVNVGYERFHAGLHVPPANTVVTGGKVGFSLFGATQFDFEVDRGIDYSIEETQPYFIRSGGRISVTQRLFGPLDVQAIGQREQLVYRPLDTVNLQPDHAWIDVGTLSTGWNLKDRSRIGINYEVKQRRSPYTDRNYNRRRIFGSWTYGF